jgi:hypothetical protein
MTKMPINKKETSRTIVFRLYISFEDLFKLLQAQSVIGPLVFSRSKMDLRIPLYILNPYIPQIIAKPFIY